MFGSRVAHVKRDEAKSGEEGGAGSGGAEPTVAEQIAAAVAKEVSGLKAKNAEVILKNKELSERVAKYGDADPEKLQAMLKHFEGSEEAKLIAEGKFDDVLNMRFAKRDAETQRQIEDAKAEVEKAKTYATRFNAKLMQGEVRAAAPTDLHPSALELAQLLADKVFTLDEEGNTIPKDGALGKNGKTPYSLKEWYEDLRGTHPTLFVNGNSGSSSFQGAGKGGAKTISREKYMTLTPAEQRDAYKNGITVVDR